MTLHAPFGLLLIGLLPVAASAQALDPADSAFRNQAFAQAWAAPVGATASWSNPVTGNHGDVKPVRESRRSNSGEPCRELVESLTINGEVRQGTTAGCRGADNGWHIVQSAPIASTAPSSVNVPVDLPAYQPPADISADAPQPARPLNLPVPVEIWLRPGQKTNGASLSPSDARVVIPLGQPSTATNGPEPQPN
jgi:surface antigen